MLSLAREETPQSLLADIGLDRQRETAFARRGKRARIEVGAEDLHRLTDLMTRRVFQQKDRERIGFLTGRTARDPDAHRLVGGFVLEQFRYHILGEFLKRRAISEERGHRNQQ